MTYNSDTIGRIVRGIVGLIILIAGIINGSWFGAAGVFLIIGAVTGKCGCSSSGCSVSSDKCER